MTLQIIEDLWNLRIDNSFDRSADKYSLGIFNSPFIIVLVSSTFADPLWNKGGSLAQGIELQTLEIAHGNFKELYLNKIAILEFPLFSGNSYELFYFPLFRLETVELKVWEYTGLLKDTAIDNLLEALEENPILNINFDSILTRLDELEMAIDNLTFPNLSQQLNEMLERLELLKTCLNCQEPVLEIIPTIDEQNYFYLQ